MPPQLGTNQQGVQGGMPARMREMRRMKISASSGLECTHASLIRKVLECSGMIWNCPIWEYASRRFCSGTCQRFLEAWSKAIQGLSFSAFAFGILDSQSHSNTAFQIGVQDLLALEEAPFVTSESELSQSLVFLTPGLLPESLPVLPEM